MRRRIFGFLRPDARRPAPDAFGFSVSPITHHELRVTSQARGFTLVEIMVVVLLIGITVSLVTLNLSRDPGKLAEEEARRFAALLDHLRDESIQTGAVYALELDVSGRSYRFLRPNPKWEPVLRDTVLRPRELAEPLRATLDTPGAPPGMPSWIFVFPTGEVSPFRFKVHGQGRNQGHAYVVQMDATQTLRVQTEADAGQI
jgi:general secretion pathway protein H